MLSEQLLLDRSGNFTASENHRLMAGWWKSKPEPLTELELPILEAIKPLYGQGERKFLVGDLKPKYPYVSGAMISRVLDTIKSQETPQGLVTYAEEKALEELSTPDPSTNIGTVHTRNGEKREPECMALLAKRTGLVFSNIGDDQAHIHANGIGCTPDGIVLDGLDLVETGAEAKCKSILEHGRLLLINNNDDLKEQAFDHFVQIQTQMLVTGANYWYFAIFNPFFKDEALQFKHIIIDRDDDFIEILQGRIDSAKAIKADFLKKFSPMVEVKDMPEPANEPVSTSKLKVEI